VLLLTEKLFELNLNTNIACVFERGELRVLDAKVEKDGEEGDWG